MSLVHRVTSTEGIDHEPEPSYPERPIRTMQRRLSYDAFQPQPVESLLPENSPEIAPYRVSKVKRILQVVVTVLSCWLASGIVFGFASLKPILIAEGVYSDKCEATRSNEEDQPCFEQDIRLNLFFIIGSITANISALPVGTLLDRYGPRVCTMAGSLLLALGSLFMALSFMITGFDAYIPGNLLLALGGTFIFVPSFQIADAFPKHSGIIVALVTGAFDASAAVFLVFALIYDASSGRFRPAQFFWAYLIVPLFILVTQLTMIPHHGYQTVPQLEKRMEVAQDTTQDVHDSDVEIDSVAELWRVRSRRAEDRHEEIRQLHEVLGDHEERKEKAQLEKKKQATSEVWGVLHGQPAHKQMASAWFILMTTLTVIQMLRMNYFIATVRSQYEYMLGTGALAKRVNDFFDVALPICGVVSTPFIGLLLDKLSVPHTLAIIVSLITVTGFLNTVPRLWAGYVTVLLFVFLRPLYYSAMSDYATKVFGFATFGRVYGTIICVSGLANCAQVLLDRLTYRGFRGNPTPVNFIMTACGFVVGTILVGFVGFEGRKWAEEHRKEDAAYERQRLIAEEPGEEDIM